MIKNIVLINDTGYVSGGVGKIAIESALALAQKYHVVFFCGLNPIDERLHASGVEVVCANLHHILTDKNRLRAIKNGLWNSKSRKLLSSLLSKLSPSDTIVHIHGWNKSLSPSILSLLKKSEFHVVITLHDYSSLCPNGGLYDYKKNKICLKKPGTLGCYFCNCDARNYSHKVWRSVRNIMLNRILKGQWLSAITIGKTNSRITKRYLNKKIKKWFFLENPCDMENSEAVDITKKQKYLFLGRLSKEKGADLFCKAISDLNLKGCVIGDGYLKKELELKYSNIEFLGWKDGEEKKKLIMQCKALVFSSLLYEGAPLTINEMKAFCIPSIVPDLCAASDYIEEGYNGFIFKIGDLDSLETAIMRCEKANLKDLQMNIVNSFNREKFSKDSHIKELINIYKDLIID